eukprot:g6223.t1
MRGRSTLEKKRDRAARRIQRNFRHQLMKDCFDDQMKMYQTAKATFDSFDYHISQKQGVKRLSVFFLFCLLFYSVLFMQKRTLEGYDTHEVIHLSLNDNEWSHTNSWMTVDNIGANVGDTVIDNVYTFIESVFLMWHRGPDTRRMSKAAKAARRRDMTTNYTRRYEAQVLSQPNSSLVIREPEDVAYDEMMRRHGIAYPLGSILYLKGNFSANTYSAFGNLLEEERELTPWVDEEVDPPSCKAMAALEKKGMAAFRQGADYLPSVPLYGRADDSAGYVYNNQRTLGVMFVTQTRYASKTCDNSNSPGTDYYRQECHDPHLEESAAFEPEPVADRPARAVKCPSEETQKELAAAFEQKLEETARRKREQQEQRGTSSSSATTATSSSSSSSSSTAASRRRRLQEKNTGLPGCTCVSSSTVLENLTASSYIVNGVLEIKNEPYPVYPVDGSWGADSCERWDKNLPPFCGDANGQPLEEPPAWCEDRWCFVDANACNRSNSISGYFPGTALSYSYDTCGTGVNSWTDGSALDLVAAITLGSCTGPLSCPRTYTDMTPCPEGCTAKKFDSPWDIVSLRPPSEADKLADPILPPDHPYAGEDFNTLKTIRATKGVGFDPFCFDNIRDNYLFMMDLGFFSFPKSAELCKLDRLKQEQWLDWQTKEVKIGIILFNANLDMFTRVVVTFKLTIGGRIFKWVDVNSYQIRDMYSSGSDFFRLFLEVVFLTMLGLLYFGNIIVWIHLCTITARWVLPEMHDYLEAYDGIMYIIDRFDSVHSVFSVYKVFNSISIGLNVVRLFINMQFHSRMGLVTKTIVRVWEDLWHFAILFFVTVFMLAFMGWNLLGKNAE